MLLLKKLGVLCHWLPVQALDSHNNFAFGSFLSNYCKASDGAAIQHTYTVHIGVLCLGVLLPWKLSSLSQFSFIAEMKPFIVRLTDKSWFEKTLPTLANAGLTLTDFTAWGPWGQLTGARMHRPISRRFFLFRKYSSSRLLPASTVSLQLSGIQRREKKVLLGVN